jgi:hypothetical protein
VLSFAPARRFRMSVSETYRARIAVARGRKVDPGPDRGPKNLKTIRRVPFTGDSAGL